MAGRPAQDAVPDPGAVTVLRDLARELDQLRCRAARGTRKVRVSLTRSGEEVQAAIAALHDEAATAAETDCKQILALYDVLERVDPRPAVTLNRAVAVARGHRLHSVRAHLLEQVGDRAAACDAYARAARGTRSL